MTVRVKQTLIIMTLELMIEMQEHCYHITVTAITPDTANDIWLLLSGLNIK